MSSPRVSIITSTYNRAQIVRRAIESVRAQTFTDWEHIIVGDCTPDDTEAVVRSFNDSRLRFFNLPEKSPPRSHGAIAKNHGILQMARGDYIAYLDDDDCYRPRFLEVMMGYVQAHPEAVLPTAERCTAIKRRAADYGAIRSSAGCTGTRGRSWNDTTSLTPIA